MHALQLLVRPVLIVFVVSSMLAIGLSARSSELIAPLKHPFWIVRALVANFVLPVAVAALIAFVLPLDPGYQRGLLLLALAAGSPLLPKIAERGRTDVATATALMVLLMGATIAVMPLGLHLFAKDLRASPVQLAAPLVILMLAPLLLGIAAQHLAPKLGPKLLPALTKASDIGFIAVLLLLCANNMKALIGVLGSGAIGAAILFIALSSAGAWLLAEPKPGARRLLGYATGCRNIGAALVTAGASGVEPKSVVMLIVTGLVGVLLLLAATNWARRREVASI